MEDAIILNNIGEKCMYLPPGFRFYPTDEEIITFYLSEKVINPGFTADALGEVDLNKSEPWELPRKAKMGEKEWYFFCQNDRKYHTGFRTNRATASGYWKATGKDKEIRKSKQELVGMKKTLVFYKGRAPNGKKTNWVMHEFRLESSPISLRHERSLQKEEWVVCKIFHKGVTHGNENAYNNEAPVVNPHCHNPNIISTNFNALIPLPNLPSLLQQTQHGLNFGHMHQQQELVQDFTQWYQTASPKLSDNRINSSAVMIDANIQWSF